jgi:hypothetical protein
MVVAWWLGTMAVAAPPAPKPASEPEIVVVPSVVEGMVRMVYAGREGDAVYVDGWNAGQLPLETQLAGGIHKFRIDGPKGRFEVERNVEVVPGQVVVVDLAPPPPPPPAPVAPAPTPAP